MKTIRTHFFKIVSLILLIAVGTLAYLYVQARQSSALSSKPDPVIAKLSKILTLPENEQAQVTVIENVEAASPNYVIVEVATSKATYDKDVIYLVNPARQEDAIVLGQGLGGSPVVSELAPGESPTEADLIVAFRDIP